VLLVLPTLAQSVASSLEPVGDPESTRTVYITVVALLGLAVGLGVLAVWLWKRTKPEPALLTPLEEMDTRTFRQLDPDRRRHVLDEVRPRGWRPVAFEEYEGPDPDDPADDETVAYRRIEDADAPTVAYVRTTMSTADPAGEPDIDEHADEPDTDVDLDETEIDDLGERDPDEPEVGVSELEMPAGASESDLLETGAAAETWSESGSGVFGPPSREVSDRRDGDDLINRADDGTSTH
jgi:hypothetical protein